MLSWRPCVHGPGFLVIARKGKREAGGASDGQAVWAVSDRVKKGSPSCSLLLQAPLYAARNRSQIAVYFSLGEITVQVEDASGTDVVTTAMPIRRLLLQASGQGTARYGRPQDIARRDRPYLIRRHGPVAI